jgi:predicted MFS family arabinose efflux permease
VEVAAIVTGVLADLNGWRGAYVALAVITLAAAAASARSCPASPGKPAAGRPASRWSAR